MKDSDTSVYKIAYIFVRLSGLGEILMAIIDLTYLAESYMKYGNITTHENWLIARILIDLTWGLFLLQKTDWIINLLQKGYQTVANKNNENN